MPRWSGGSPPALKTAQARRYLQPPGISFCVPVTAEEPRFPYGLDPPAAYYEVYLLTARRASGGIQVCLWTPPLTTILTLLYLGV